MSVVQSYLEEFDGVFWPLHQDLALTSGCPVDRLTTDMRESKETSKTTAVHGSTLLTSTCACRSK